MPKEHDARSRSPDRRRATEQDTSEQNPLLEGLNERGGLFGEIMPDDDGLDLRAGQQKQEFGRNPGRMGEQFGVSRTTSPRVAPSSVSVNETMNRYKKSQAQKFSEHTSKPHEVQGANTPLDTGKPDAVSDDFVTAFDKPVSLGDSKWTRGKKARKAKTADKQTPDDTADLQAERQPPKKIPLDIYTDEQSSVTDEAEKMPAKPGALSHERPSALQQERGRLSHKRTPPVPVIPTGRKQKYNMETAHRENQKSQNATFEISPANSHLKHDAPANRDAVSIPDTEVLRADSDIRADAPPAKEGERRLDKRADENPQGTADSANRATEPKTTTAPHITPSPIIAAEHGTANLTEEKPAAPTAEDTSVVDSGKSNSDSGDNNKNDSAKVDGDADRNDDFAGKKKTGESKLKFEDDSKPADGSASDKPVGDSKSGKKLEKAERKLARSSEKLEKAKGNLPTKRKLRTNKEFDAETGKMKPRLRFEEQVKTQQEHLRGSAVTRPIKTGANIAGGIAHKKVFQHEDENVGVKAAHKGELLAESGVRTAYRHQKLSPYRKVQKLEARTRKLGIRAAHRKALHENPALKKKPLAKMMQKRRIKQQYAKAARKAMLTGKKTALATKFAVAVKAKVAVIATKTVVAVKAVVLNPKVLLVIAAIVLIIILILGLVSACSSVATSVGQSIAAVSYMAEDDCIDDAVLLYSEMEVDLRLEILNVEENWPDIDEFRLDIGAIGHCPLMLMAYLTAVHHDFTFAEIEDILREIFAEQYSLEFTPEVEIRTRMEEREGSTTDPETGEPVTYTYEVEVEYEWHILNVTLTSQSFFEVINARMEEGQRQHYFLLMQSRGMRQIVQSPFAFNWTPFVSSHYGWRISPITGEKQLHRGIDIGLPTGTEILAATDGTVTFAGDMGGFGLVVFIDNGEGIVTVYAHCDTLLVSTGQTVEVGDVIATVGSTGDSTGPHLHFEIIKNGRHLNPAFYTFAGIF